eukprot:CAMPEP_0201875244 /NCGR_PEP_ID=MMETSP0902-20130614/7268_1 /ASSEMBLY_ACC=CAM_ASM_000551 /TAXON_ID=420261 /ORGANISM="Thalassiosira antarctica, Strain CCMP982" /LENGTH=1151 /DNA_ID=CAMNT_0048402259 /DNA_START=179 /DNA_END=3634 /DNA_ORIENTATION=+
MDALTEDQRRRTELNRQRALEKARERREKKCVQKEIWDQTAPLQNQPDNDGHHAFDYHSPTAMDTMASDNKASRESFGDSGIDWEAAVGEVDRLLANSTSSGVIMQSNNDTRTNKTTAQSLPNNQGLENKRRKMENVNTQILTSQYNSQKSGLTEEQRARMDENRRKALEKKQQKSLLSSSKSAQQKSTIQCPSHSDEQRARMEENRRKALAKKQQMSTSATIQCPLPTVCNDEQRARMEENRQRALEKKQQMPQLVSGLPKITLQCSSSTVYNDDQIARMEESRKRALEKKHQKLQLSKGPVGIQGPDASSSIKCPSPKKCSDEQRARMEENRRKALEKKQQMSKVPAPSAPVLPKNTIQCPSPTIFNDENRARMEENRRKALEKKQQMSQLAVVASLEFRCPSPTITNEHRAGMEESSLDRKQQVSQATSPTPAVLPNSTYCPSPKNDVNSIQCPSPTITNEHRARLEESKREAFIASLKEELEESKHESSSKVALPHDAQDFSEPPASEMNSRDVASHENPKIAFLKEEQRASVDDNRHLALQNQKLASSAPSTDACVPHNNTTMNPPLQELAATSASVSSELDHEKAPAPSPIKAASTKKSALPKIPLELQYDPNLVLPIIDDDIDTLIENAELDKPLLNDMTLYDHQKEGVLRALRMRRLILAFDMGLGKTIIACAWAKAFVNTFEGIKVIIIAPVTLHDDWRRNATEATGLKVDPGGKKKKVKAKKKKKKEEDTGKTVTGKRKKKAKKIESDSEELSECEPPNNFDVYVFSWQGTIACKNIITDIVSDSGYVVICDEAHSMQTMTSKRTEDVLKLVFPKKCRGVLLLSGTPMKNGKPTNLFPLLQAVKHPFGDNQKRYEFYFCNGQQREMRGKSVWDASGSSNLEELNAHTASHIFRLTKEECLKLPPRKREFKKVPISPRHELRYTQALKDLAQAFSSSQTYGGGGENDSILTPLHKLRQVSAIAKVDAIVLLANSILVEESSIVIFSSFVGVCKEIYEKLGDMDWGGELLTGQTPKQKRQAKVDRFQSGLSPVFVCTYGAGGVGLTLTAACTVILVDRPWTPGDVAQAEDRVRRIGQKRPVRSVWIRAFPIDEQIDAMIDHKEENSNTVVDGKKYGGQNKSAPKVKISELVQSVLSNKDNGGE